MSVVLIKVGIAVEPKPDQTNSVWVDSCMSRIWLGQIHGPLDWILVMYMLRILYFTLYNRTVLTVGS